MCKQLLAITFFWLYCLQFTAQKLITISFCNNDDTSTGPGCVQDAQKNMHAFCSNLSKLLGYQYDEQVFTGTRFTEANFLNFEKSISSAKEDIGIFYISTHGGRTPRDKTKFPQVQIAGSVFSVYERYEVLKNMPHRTLITIIYGCNNFSRFITPKEISLFPHAFIPNLAAAISANSRANAKRLLADNAFDEIVTSSQIGLTSLSTDAGSVFTNSLVSAFYYFLNSNNGSLASIDNVLTISYDLTINESQTLFRNNNWKITEEDQPHFPIWEPDPPQKSAFTGRKDIQSDQFMIKDSITLLMPAEKLRLRTNNDYQISFYTSASDSLMSKIKTVKYILHHTFRKQVVYATDVKNNYLYKITVRGEFSLRVEVKLKDGTVIDLAKDLKLK